MLYGDVPTPPTPIPPMAPPTRLCAAAFCCTDEANDEGRSGTGGASDDVDVAAADVVGPVGTGKAAVAEAIIGDES